VWGTHNNGSDRQAARQNTNGNENDEKEREREILFWGGHAPARFVSRGWLVFSHAVVRDAVMLEEGAGETD